MSKNPVNKISVKVMCLIQHNRKLLVNKGYDKVKKQTFYRLIGGKVEFGERMEDAIKREIKEELNCEVKSLEFITAKEGIFTYEGERGHEANFLYKVELEKEDLFEKEIIPNPDSDEFPAVWISIADVLSEKVILYPSFDYKTMLLLG